MVKRTTAIDHDWRITLSRWNDPSPSGSLPGSHFCLETG